MVEPPTLEETLERLRVEHMFQPSGEEFFTWVSRVREALRPTPIIREWVARHVVFPNLNLHIIHSRWVASSGNGREVIGERVDFEPWVKSLRVKYVALKRWALDSGLKEAVEDGSA